MADGKARIMPSPVSPGSSLDKLRSSRSPFGVQQMKHFAAALAIVLPLVAGGGAAAFTDCKDEVRELREKINDDRGDYSLAARTEAKRHLAAAELTFMQPLKCRQNLREARRSLRRGEK